MINRIHTASQLNHAVALIRHADRDKIPDGEFGNDVLLNEKGIENSIAFGRNLKNINIVKILTSPVQRCVQTAEYITEGYGKSLIIENNYILGDPGIHINDAVAAGDYYLKHGAFMMYEQFMKGEEVPGMPKAAAFRVDFTDFLQKTSHEDGLTLMISHDFLIAVADFALHQKKYTPTQWVNYLDGFMIHTR